MWSLLLRYALPVVALSPVGVLLWLNPGIAAGWAALPVAAGVAIGDGLRRAARSRERRLADATLPEGVREAIEDLVPFFHRLEPVEQEEFLTRCAMYLAEHVITGVGVEVDDDLRACVAASAVIVTFGVPRGDWGPRREVLLYPERFEYDYSMGEDGELLGMVHPQGPVILVADELVEGFARGEDGYNVGIHEFAHVIDHEGGGIDGIPAWIDRESAEEWSRRVWEVLPKAEEDSPLRRLLDDYAYSDEVEFFACLSEIFFELPDALHDADAALYDLMRRMYRQDPLARLSDEDREALELGEDWGAWEEEGLGPEIGWEEEHG